MSLENGRFIIENYHQGSVFSSFLPGIGGVKGIPIWCYYVNRGQGVVSFGTETKDQSIMEFYPAHQSYQIVKTMGFRTFMKIDGKYYEPFQDDQYQTKMYIGMDHLEIEETNERAGIRTNVKYYTLPEEKLGGLIRELTITNLRGNSKILEVLDGMPAIIPYGIDLKSLKETGQTMKAWMQVEDVELKLPYYRVKISTKDTAEVSEVSRGNYFFSVGPHQELLPIIADPSLIFCHDTSCQNPVGFLKESIDQLLLKKQVTRNNVPSGFSAFHGELPSKSSIKITSVSGMAENKKILKEFASKAQKDGYFLRKKEVSGSLMKNLTSVIGSSTGNPMFDEYAKQTYLDNMIRGGCPVKIGDKVIHVFSRKHGDIERDYNYFKLSPEYYSQGNGNYRDVNQNRRNDIRFYPFIKDTNIKAFYNLIQIDGYNPLIVEATTYKLELDDDLRSLVPDKDREALSKFFTGLFSPGKLLRFLEEERIKPMVPVFKFIEQAVKLAKEIQNAEFGEGYWTDHFVYNLDQIEAYLSVYPEMIEPLLFDDLSFTYYESKAIVLPRDKRYVETSQGIRQYHALDKTRKKSVQHMKLRTGFGEGKEYSSSLMTKLMVIIANKFTSLDMDGRGIEMEAGKPGWYDALNGLPGLFGSSVADACELLRLMKFVEFVSDKFEREIFMPIEVYQLISNVNEVMKSYDNNEATRFEVWDKLNYLKEIYRESVMFGIDGHEAKLLTKGLANDLSRWIEYLSVGLDDAFKENHGICPTYYMREMTKYEKRDGIIIPRAFIRTTLPLFLEGPVKYLKLIEGMERKKEVAKKVKSSALYDEKLKMYKVNASLDNVSYEVGRAKAFSPGWLENESIWLHMEYKYLLELLKNDLHIEFHEDLKTMAIPFLDFDVYGRSLLENSSFIASSANPDERIHGKGFVSRLSGSTAEFLEIWQLMMFGKNCFENIEGELSLTFRPSIPDYLVPENLVLETTFLGTIKTRFHFKKKESLIPGGYVVKEILLSYVDGQKKRFKDRISGDDANNVREGLVESIDVYFEQ